jgi:hypothetical protein
MYTRKEGTHLPSRIFIYGTTWGGINMKRILKCENCTKEFSTYKKNGKYCSAECYHKHGTKKSRPSRTVKRITALCLACGNDFEYKETEVKKYCCFSCYRDSHRSEEKGKVIECKQCGIEFAKKSSDQLMCSKACSVKALLVSNGTDYLEDIKCAQCNKEFHPHDKNKKYCSQECFNEYNSNRRIVNCEKCGDPFKRWSTTHKYCSNECKGLDNMGENNATFKGYLTNNGDYKRYSHDHPQYPSEYVHRVVWFEAHKGEHCNRCENEVEHIHHIDRDKGNNELINLEGLCATCHAKEHSQESEFWLYR